MFKQITVSRSVKLDVPTKILQFVPAGTSARIIDAELSDDGGFITYAVPVTAPTIEICYKTFDGTTAPERVVLCGVGTDTKLPNCYDPIANGYVPIEYCTF